MPRDVHVRGAHLRSRCQIRQGERHVDVVRHQAEHALVETAGGVPEQAAEVSQAPAVIDGRGDFRHANIVRQTDEKTRLLISTGRVKVLVKHPACEYDHWMRHLNLLILKEIF
jgi:hypothetical protein